MNAKKAHMNAHFSSLTDESDWLGYCRVSGVYIFGCGMFGRALKKAAELHGITVLAFIVTSPQAEICEGLPVLALDELTALQLSRPVWIGVFNRSQDACLAGIHRTLAAAGFERIILPQMLYGTLADQLGWRYWLHRLSDYEACRAEIEEGRACLEDEESRGLYDLIIRFRMAEMEGEQAWPVQPNQYFPSFLMPFVPSTTNFIDVGAYTGDTLAQAAKSISISGYWAFEPDPENFARLSERARAHGFAVTCTPCGVSSRNGTALFSSGQGEASMLGQDGGHSVQLIRLDDCLCNIPVHFIKMDVEGHELEALAGAQQIIARHRPILAISGYHNWNDLWLIPRWIKQNFPEYRVRLQSHASNTFDAVYYAY